ncbi:MAG: RNase adapter RapZ [Elusimicrobia bacterium]|nr:RNase adapter RapZ [Elusimicrobiota bacterium]MDE2313214.1 RNase adapter RapZ [Elusimicrobiota bacterium]
MKRGSKGAAANARKIFVISGISGAGKSQALKAFEDLGFFCVDNLPVALLKGFTALMEESRNWRLVALGMDIREGRLIETLPQVLGRLKRRGIDYRILFLEASDAAIIQRFSETRHRHPLGLKLPEAIREERRRLVPIKAIADKVIDTSTMTLGELKEAVSATLELSRPREMTLSAVSFGYKYGLPIDADIVMDVRFLPNPNYVPGLRRKTGLDAPVKRYIMALPEAREFLKKYLDLISALIPQYMKEGKSYLTVAVGCTGGRHRSVCLTHLLAQELKKKGHPVQEFHRDVRR